MNNKSILTFIIAHLFLQAFPASASTLKVLLNAEPFGFGPSAAITELFPYLRTKIDHLSYTGTGHTLDLQRNLPYDNIYDYGAADPNERKAKFTAIAQQYDLFITACNYEAAEWAKDLGLKLVIYDPLTWYWATLPTIISQADLYIAQNFFGVIERIENESTKFPEYAVVPAIVSAFHRNDEEKNIKDIALINMGGLSNPYIQNENFIIFAKMVFDSANDSLAPKFDEIVYATSAAIATATKDTYPAQTLQPQQIQKILNNSRVAIMTSGLGNIYEASMLQKFVIWLPPANDSQGQQVKLLEKHGMLDFAIDWHDILQDEPPIDYFAPQLETLKRIAICIEKLSNNLEAQEKFKNLLEGALSVIEANPHASPALAKLSHIFGVNGAKKSAEAILQKFNPSFLQPIPMAS